MWLVFPQHFSFSQTFHLCFCNSIARQYIISISEIIVVCIVVFIAKFWHNLKSKYWPQTWLRSQCISTQVTWSGLWPSQCASSEHTVLDWLVELVEEHQVEIETIKADYEEQQADFKVGLCTLFRVLFGNCPVSS